MLRSVHASRGDTPARKDFARGSHRRLRGWIEQCCTTAQHRPESNLSDASSPSQHSNYL